MKNTLLISAFLLLFIGSSAFTPAPGFELARTKTFTVYSGSITARMLDNGLTEVSWTSLDNGGVTTVAVTNLSTYQTVTGQAPNGVNSTTFAGLQTQQPYRFRVENSKGSIVIIDVVVS